MDVLLWAVADELKLLDVPQLADGCGLADKLQKDLVELSLMAVPQAGGRCWLAGRERPERQPQQLGKWTT